MSDYGEFPLILSANIENVAVDNYDANVFSKSLQASLNPHSAARRHAALAGFQEQLSRLGSGFTITHATTLNENASLDNLYLERLTYRQYWMECTVMAATLDPPLPTKVGIDRVELSSRKDVLESYKTWYEEHARSLSDQFFEATSEMICIAVAAAGPRAVVQQGFPTANCAYPNWRCLIETPHKPNGFAVAFNFISPKRFPKLRR